MELLHASGDLPARRDEILAPPDPALYTIFARLLRESGGRVVVSFGGGSVPGLCGNVALARILEELDLRGSIHEVWGTSAGAVVGGIWASGTEAGDILANVAALDRRGSVDVAWLSLLKTVLLRPFGHSIPDGLVLGRHFTRTIEASLKARTFEECAIPFRCIACTDDGHVRRKIFRRGRLLPAILSSMSIPGVMIPRPREPGEDTGYYDGGLVEKTPLYSPISEHQRLHGKRPLVILGTHYGNEARAAPAQGFIDRFLACIHAMEEVCWSYQLAEARNREDVRLLLLLNPKLDDPGLFDFSRVERNYLHARASFLAALQNGRIALTFGMK